VRFYFPGCKYKIQVRWIEESILHGRHYYYSTYPLPLWSGKITWLLIFIHRFHLFILFVPKFPIQIFQDIDGIFTPVTNFTTAQPVNFTEAATLFLCNILRNSGNRLIPGGLPGN
jgi:hypothetical protein